MAILRGADAIAYLQQNPTSTYKDLSTGQWANTPEQSKGLIGGLIRGITQPFTRGLDVLSAIGDPTYQAQYGYTAPEWEAARERGLGQEALKSAAGIATTFVPGGQAFGGGIGGALASGAVGGGLSGLSQVEDLRDPTQALAGVGMGALGGTAGSALGFGLEQGLSALGQKLQQPVGLAGEAVEEVAEQPGLRGKAVEGLRGYEEGRKVNALKRIVGGGTPTKKLGGADMLKDTVKLSEQYNIPINTVDDAVTLSAKMFEDYGTKVKDFVVEQANNGVRIDPDTILPKLEAIKDAAVPSKRAAAQKAIDDFTMSVLENGDDLASMYTLKQNFGKLGKWNNFATDVTPAQKEVYEKAYNMINDAIEAKMGPEFREANKMVQRSMQIGDYATKGQMRDIPGATFNDPMQDVMLAGNFVAGGPGAIAGGLVGKGVQSPQFERGLGQVAGKVADVLEKGRLPEMPNVNLSGMGQMLQNIPEGTFSRPAGLAGGMLSQGGLSGDQTQEQPTMAGGMGAGSQIPIQQAGGMGGQAGLGGIDPQQLGMAVLSGAISPEVAKTYLSITQPQQSTGSLSEAASQYAMATNAGMGLYNTLNQTPEVAGKVKGLAGKVERGLGMASPRTQYKSQIDSFNSFVRRAMLGSGQTDVELKKIESMLPKETDSAAIAKQKLEQVIPLLQSYGTPSQGGLGMY